MTLRLPGRKHVEWLEGTLTWVTQEHREAGFAPVQATDATDFVSLKVWQTSVPATVDASITDFAFDVACEATGRQPLKRRIAKPRAAASPWNQAGQTVIEAVTPLLTARGRDGKLDIQRSLSAAFDRCIESVERLVSGYRLMTRDYRATTTNRNTVFPAIPWTTREPAGQSMGIGVFNVNSGLRHMPSPADIADRDLVNNIATAVGRLEIGDPLLQAAHELLMSWRALEVDGNAAGALVHAAVACEMMFDNVLLMSAWEDELSPAEVAGWFREGLPKRLVTYYGVRFGTNWDWKNPKTVPGQWRENVHVPRSRYVHGGTQPSFATATRAAQQADEVIEFLIDRVVERRHQYPRTALLLAGRPGLIRRGLCNGKIKKFIEEVASEEPAWIPAFREWVERVTAERES